tara:strand:- start:415 stop:552 length:138 start_codon:yes stop_codon:yes gene_type:complete
MAFKLKYKNSAFPFYKDADDLIAARMRKEEREESDKMEHPDDSDK